MHYLRKKKLMVVLCVIVCVPHKSGTMSYYYDFTIDPSGLVYKEEGTGPKKKLFQLIPNFNFNGTCHH